MTDGDEVTIPEPRAGHSGHESGVIESNGGHVGARLRWGEDRAGIIWALALIALVALGSFSWFDQIEYQPPAFGDDEATRAALEDLRVVPVGEELSMASTAPSRWIMGDGFGVPEDDGTWVAAIRADLNFEVEEVPASTVDLYLFPLLSAALTERPISITTAVGVTEVRLTGGGQWVTAPLSQDLAQQVVIKCETVDSPLDLGLGPDQRKLCAKLIAVRLNP
jgi:hypothetical protein